MVLLDEAGVRYEAKGVGGYDGGMATIETSPDSARSDLSMEYLFTSKNLTHRQKLYRWVVIGSWGSSSRCAAWGCGGGVGC